MIIRGRSYNIPITRDIVNNHESGYYGIVQPDRKKLTLNRFGAVEVFQVNQVTRVNEPKVHDEFEFPYEIPAEDTCLAYTIFEAANMLATRLINRLSINYEQGYGDYNIEIQHSNTGDIAQLYIVIHNKFGNNVCEAMYFIVRVNNKTPNRGEQTILDIK